MDASKTYPANGRPYPPGLNPLHGILVAATIPLFLGALLSDITYAYSYHVQWSNFASWLIAGGLVFNGLALVWGLVCLLFCRCARHYCWYVLLLAITWVAGFFAALIHARDAWAMMPHGLVLSAITFLLACAAVGMGFKKFGVGGAVDGSVGSADGRYQP